MRRKANEEVPGNAMASAAVFAQQMVSLGESITQFEFTLDHLFDKGIDVQSVRIRMPTADDVMYLVVIKAVVHDQPSVAFHGDETFALAVRGAIARLRNQTIKWRDDTYGN